jgi:hypothetical protein
LKKIKDVSGSPDHDWLSVHGGLMTMGQCGRFGALEVIVAAQRERERERRRRSLGFSPMASLGGGTAEMDTRQCSIDVAGGALIERWFRTRGGEIGAEVDAVDNGGALITPFIGS